MKVAKKFFAIIFLGLSIPAFADQCGNSQWNCVLQFAGGPLQGANFCADLSGKKTLVNLCDGHFCVADSKYIRRVSQKICTESGGLPQLAATGSPKLMTEQKLIGGVPESILKEKLCKQFRLKPEFKEKCVEHECGSEPFEEILQREFSSMEPRILNKFEMQKANRPIFITPSFNAESGSYANFKQQIVKDYFKDGMIKDMTLMDGLRFIVLLDGISQKDSKMIFDIKSATWKSSDDAFPSCE